MKDPRVMNIRDRGAFARRGGWVLVSRVAYKQGRVVRVGRLLAQWKAGASATRLARIYRVRIAVVEDLIRWWLDNPKVVL